MIVQVPRKRYKTAVGFYLRKSVTVGPFRFNLSGSGIGVSTGIKGFRIGTGPRGNYVHMGRGGIYFRQTIPTSDSRGTPSLVPQEKSSRIDFKEIESGSVSQWLILHLLRSLKK
jgi:hypothetical protein